MNILKFVLGASDRLRLRIAWSSIIKIPDSHLHSAHLWLQTSLRARVQDLREKSIVVHVGFFEDGLYAWAASSSTH